MRSFKRLKLLLILSLISLISFFGIIAYREIFVFRRSEPYYWIILSLLVLFPLLHIFILFSIGNVFYPDKQISRSFHIGFHIVSGFSWLSIALFVMALIFVLIDLDETPNMFQTGDVYRISIFVLFWIVSIVLLIQMIYGYRFVAFIRRKQKEMQLLETFN